MSGDQVFIFSLVAIMLFFGTACFKALLNYKKDSQQNAILKAVLGDANILDKLNKEETIKMDVIANMAQEIHITTLKNIDTKSI